MSITQAISARQRNPPKIIQPTDTYQDWPHSSARTCHHLQHRREGAVPDWEVKHFPSFSWAVQQGWRTSTRVRPPTGPSGFQPPQHTMTLWGSGQSTLAKPVAPTSAVPRAWSPGATTPSSSDVLGWLRITAQYGPGSATPVPGLAPLPCP